MLDTPGGVADMFPLILLFGNCDSEELALYCIADKREMQDLNPECLIPTPGLLTTTLRHLSPIYHGVIVIRLDSQWWVS